MFSGFQALRALRARCRSNPTKRATRPSKRTGSRVEPPALFAPFHSLACFLAGSVTYGFLLALTLSAQDVHDLLVCVLIDRRPTRFDSAGDLSVAVFVSSNQEPISIAQKSFERTVQELTALRFNVDCISQRAPPGERRGPLGLRSGALANAPPTGRRADKSRPRSRGRLPARSGRDENRRDRRVGLAPHQQVHPEFARLRESGRYPNVNLHHPRR